MTKPKISVDVVSDVACPWCYLGKHSLAKAIDLVPELDVVVRWHPYRLDPTIPPEGMDRSDYIIGKFGSLAALDQAHARLTEMGRALGIQYHFERITRAADTIDAHRLVRWAGAIGKEDAAVERLFSAYFSEGLDIGDRAVLARLAGEIGLNPTEIAARLATDTDKAAVEHEIEEAYRIGVTGVPTFIIDQRYGVVGAQSAEVLASAIRKAASEASASATA